MDSVFGEAGPTGLSERLPLNYRIADRSSGGFGRLASSRASRRARNDHFQARRRRCGCERLQASGARSVAGIPGLVVNRRPSGALAAAGESPAGNSGRHGRPGTDSHRGRDSLVTRPGAQRCFAVEGQAVEWALFRLQSLVRASASTAGKPGVFHRHLPSRIGSVRRKVPERAVGLRVPGQLPTGQEGKSPASSSCAVSLFPFSCAPDAEWWSVMGRVRQLWGRPFMHEGPVVPNESDAWCPIMNPDLA